MKIGTVPGGQIVAKPNDFNQFSVSVSMPARSFLSNSTKKIPNIKSKMKSILSNKPDDIDPLKPSSTKSAKNAVSGSSYLKKFKSHQTNNK